MNPEIEDPDTIKITWSTDDILGRAEQTEVSLTRKQAREILHMCKASHDCDTGINWYSIDSIIDTYLQEVAKGK